MTLDAEIDALLGDTAPRLSDTSERERRRMMTQVRTGRGTFVEGGELKRPVTQAFLASTFDMNPKTVSTRLVACPKLTSEGDTRPLYDFKQAVGYLVEPKMDIEKYIKNLDPARMPNHINKVFWEAARGRLKYLVEAGEAWMTVDVLDVFGKVFLTIKDRTQLWTETLRDRGGLSDDALRRLEEMVDALLSDLHDDLVKIPSTHQTPAIADELINEVGGTDGE